MPETTESTREMADRLAMWRELLGRMNQVRGHIEDMGTDERLFMLGALAGSLQFALDAIDRVLALCKDTDGNYLPGDSELPVGEFQAALTGALLGGDGDGG